MDDLAPFRILSNEAFQALPRADKLRYLARAIQAHRVLVAQIASGAAEQGAMPVVANEQSSAEAAQGRMRLVRSS